MREEGKKARVKAKEVAGPKSFTLDGIKARSQFGVSLIPDRLLRDRSSLGLDGKSIQSLSNLVYRSMLIIATVRIP